MPTSVPNEEIARIFLDIADLLDLEGVKFKPESYRRAARALSQLPEDVSDLVRSGRIREVPGIGEALSEKVREYVSTGEVPYLLRLREKWPPGLLEIMRLEGVGPKTTRRFFLEFQVTGPEDLERLIGAGKLRGVSGFGDRKIELLQKALARGTPTHGAGPEGRLPLPRAQERADELLQALHDAKAPIDRCLFAGSLRRRRETVGDLDLLATSAVPREVMDLFVHLPDVEEVRLSGETKSTVRLRGGLQVDLRVVPTEAFGAALQYFTGSKDHNVRLRSLAIKKGYRLNEYGLAQGEQLLPMPTEEEVYAALGLAWIPPEMREDHGEIEAAAPGPVPPVVQDRDLRGEMHIHVPSSIGREDVETWVPALRRLGLTYAGFVVRSQELSLDAPEWPALRASLPREIEGVRVLLGAEVTLGASGWPAAPAGADFLVGRLPLRAVSDPKAWILQVRRSAPALPSFLGHLGEGDLATAHLTWKQLVDGDGPVGVLEVAVSHDKVVTETPWVREAAGRSTELALSGWPRLPEELPRLLLASGVARRGWVLKEHVWNARPEPVRWTSPEDPPASWGRPNGGAER